ncbi:hypothetical protein F6Q10_10800 [Streptomyces vinaceus]|nr:hypothetical protein [Streptomyces vinaceus]
MNTPRRPGGTRPVASPRQHTYSTPEGNEHARVARVPVRAHACPGGRPGGWSSGRTGRRARGRPRRFHRRLLGGGRPARSGGAPGPGRGWRPGGSAHGARPGERRDGL